MIETLEKLTPEEIQEFLILDYLKKETGFPYSFALNSGRCWNEKDNVESKKDDTYFYQIMPDGIDNGFFNWYALERQYNQFFETKEEAFKQFLKYWKTWKGNNS